MSFVKILPEIVAQICPQPPLPFDLSLDALAYLMQSSWAKELVCALEFVFSGAFSDLLALYIP